MKTFVISLERQAEVRNNKIAQNTIETQKQTTTRKSYERILNNKNTRAIRERIIVETKKINDKLVHEFDNATMKNYRVYFTNVLSNSVKLLFIDNETHHEIRHKIDFDKYISNDIAINRFYDDVKNYIYENTTSHNTLRFAA